MTILNILSPNLTLYDLQKPRYVYPIIAATPKKGVAFLGVISVNTNYVSGYNLF